MINFLKTSKLSVLIAVILAILVLLNLISYNLFRRWDITENKLYSLSDFSKQTVRQLDDDLVIEVYFGPELPPQYINLEQEVKNILAEYASYSGKLQIKYIDPSQLSEAAAKLRIPRVQFNTYQKDKMEVINGYLGLAIKYKGKTEVLPVIQDVSNLEYLLTSLIKKLSMDKVPVIGFVQSNASWPLETELSTVKEKISSLYQVANVDLEAEGPIDTKIDTLVIPGPQAAMSESALKKIDEFLMQGKSVLALVDDIVVTNTLASHPSATNLPEFLVNYGLQVNDKFVLDNSSGMASFNQGFITFNLPYPLWPKIVNKNFDQNNAIVAELEGVVLPWVTSLDLDVSKIDKSDQISYLAKSSQKAWTKEGQFDLNPNKKLYNNEAYNQFNLAISLAGKLKSAYGQVSTDNGKLIVIADSDFIRNNFVARFPQNLIFFQNLIDGLSLDADLVNIRAKQISDRPIKELTANQKKMIRYGNVFGTALLVLLLGLARYYMRKQTKDFEL